MMTLSASCIIEDLFHAHCRCDGCKKLVAARKQLTIFDDPNVLVAHFKRFDGFSGGKISRHIAFADRLTLEPFMSQNNRSVPPPHGSSSSPASGATGPASHAASTSASTSGRPPLGALAKNGSFNRPVVYGPAAGPMRDASDHEPSTSAHARHQRPLADPAGTGAAPRRATSNYLLTGVLVHQVG